MANFLYGKNFTWGANFFDRRSTDPLTALRGWAFDAYLGMFSISQLFMQSMQVVNIVGIAGAKGYQGAALYGPMRFLLNNGNSAVTQRVAQLLRNVVGLDADQFEDMLDMFRRSGRGIVDNNVAEMSMAEDAASQLGRLGFNQRVRDVREAGRVFFKEGDLVARITAFNTAYLEAVEKFGRRTAANSNAFTRWVDHRQQVLTQGMTSASRQGYEQLPFMQFMTYQLRINEALFAGTFSNSKTVLTLAEKRRLILTHAVMFGAMSNTITGVLSQYVEANTNIPASPEVVRLAQRGMLDFILSYLSGEDTAASSRYASSMGLYQIMDQIARENPLVVLGGPSVQFGWTAADGFLGTVFAGIRGIYSGDANPFRAELTDLARITASGNSLHNAYTAYTLGRYYTKRSGLVADDLRQSGGR